MTTKKHWAADEAARERLKDFGATHGLGAESILEILGVEKINNFTGTEAEAIATIVQWVQDNAPPEPPDPQTGDEPAYQPPVYEPVELSEDVKARYDEAAKEIGSVPVWIRMDGRGHYEVSVQAWLPPALTRVGLAYARQALEDYQGIFADVLIPANGNGQPAGNGRPALTTAPPVAGGNGNGDLTFEAEKLVANVSEGNVYWKVKGGKYSQFGVTIWPEVLKAAGFNLDDLDPTQTYTLSGTAHYILNDNGNPQKVVKLEAA